MSFVVGGGKRKRNGKRVIQEQEEGKEGGSQTSARLEECLLHIFTYIHTSVLTIHTVAVDSIACIVATYSTSKHISPVA